MLPLTRDEKNAFVFVIIVCLAGAGLRLTARISFISGWHDKARIEHLIFKRDLNRASYDDLLAVPGIGPAAARHIIGYRTDHERFTSIDELRKVISTKAFALAQDHVEVRP